MSLPPRHFTELTFEGAAADEVSAWIAILPLGATEQHGPHLPFETDTLIAQGIVNTVIATASSTLPITVLPVEPVGYSPEHMDVEGTQTLAFDEAIGRWIRIGETLHAKGIRKLVMMNAHGGNSPLMTIVATELRVRFGMLAVATSWTRFIPPDMIAADEKAFGIHGGQIETSVMLALHPELVRMEKARDFSSLQANHTQTFTHLRAYGPHAYGWKMSDLNEDGVTGNASVATAALGQRLIDETSKGIIQLLEDVNSFNPPWLGKC